jgi:rod shape-determining protein MreD
MIRSILLSSLIMTLCAILQSTIVQKIALWGVIPDFALIVLIYTSIKNGSMEGQVSGFASGIATDFISRRPLGFTVFTQTIIGFVYGIFKSNVFIDFIIAPFLMAFIATIFKALLTVILSIFFPGSSVKAYSFFTAELWIESLYNAVLAPFVFAFLSIFKRFLLTQRDRL